MKYNINGREYTYTIDVKGCKEIRDSFNELTRATFDFDFQWWYDAGYWSDMYVPHALLDGNRVVANVSVNIINTIWNGRQRRYLQIGTVMTDVQYRGHGLSRWLMERILEKYKSDCDAIYLSANDTVLDYYPKFGFIQVNEYQYKARIIPSGDSIRKLDMNKANDVELLRTFYKKSNPFSALPLVGNIGLIMFYCSELMSDHIYYVEQSKAVVIATPQGSEMHCYDIFCESEQDLNKILSAVAQPETQTIVFGFTPLSTVNYGVSLLKEENATLFVLADKENIFADNKVMLPLLAHA